MRISVFTPTHDTRYLCEAYASLEGQLKDSDEWVILYNGGAAPLGLSKKDHRVKEFSRTDLPPYVGALKRAACEECKGDILLELDHDDLLLPGAIEEVRSAFLHDPEVGYVYSNFVEQNMDGSARQRFTAGAGWLYRPTTVNGAPADETVAFDPTPASVSKIWYAPNHLRAFRRDEYLASGGYNPDMRVLDDQDLMSRMYAQGTGFYHIDKPLYLYRVHGENSWLQHCAEIQDNVFRLYDQYIDGMARAWADRNALLALDLGGRLDPRPGYICVDYKDDPNVGIVTDLNDPWPWEDGSVGVIRAFDVFEHLRDPLHTMKELYRVLAPGGYAFIQVPSTDGRGAFQDPTHVSFWNENSFLYYTNRDWARWIDTPVRFQAMRLYTTELNDQKVCWVRADLQRLEHGERYCGQVLI